MDDVSSTLALNDAYTPMRLCERSNWAAAVYDAMHYNCT